MFLQDFGVAIGLFALLLAGLEIGFRAGKRAMSSSDAAGGQVGAVQGAILGLLGLLLAFSFAAAGARFLERQDLIVAEANAIGTSTYRADLLDEPHRTMLRDALREYTQHRVAISVNIRKGVSEAELHEIDGLHAKIWAAASSGVRDRESIALAVLNPVNEVIDLHSLRIAAGRKHLPVLVLGLLIACSLMAMAVIGYACGLSKNRRAPLTMSLALLIGTALWITIDLDHPRSGLLQLNEAPLKALRFDEPAMR